MKKTPSLPIPLKRALYKLGLDIRSARIKRRITTMMMAERAYTTRPTLSKVEKGDPSVSMGVYANVLFILGMDHRLAELVDARYDEFGLDIVEETLPKRVRPRKSNPF